MDKNKKPLNVILTIKNKKHKKDNKYKANKYGGYNSLTKNKNKTECVGKSCDMPKQEQCQAFTQNGTRCTREAAMTGKFMRKIALNGLLDKVGLTNTEYDGEACCNLCWQHLKVASASGITNVVNTIAKSVGVLDNNEKCIVHPQDCWIYVDDNPNEIKNWGNQKTKGLFK